MRRLNANAVGDPPGAIMGARDQFAFFWGGPFSQWHSANFTLHGIAFNCAEQYMMFCKARLFGDIDSSHKIAASRSAREQKALGRRIANFDEHTWLIFREGIVFTGNLAKFSQNESLRATLLATGDKTLVEASPRDTIWGVGLAEDDPRITDPSQWRGANLLGQILMRVRSCLR